MADRDPATDIHDTLAAVGEFAVIDRLLAGRAQPESVTLGPGDDAAVVAIRDGRTAVSTDMLVQDRHFRLDWSRPHDVGRKAIAQNAADIEAMGGRATAFFVSFGAPADTATADAVELADGMWHEARKLGAGIAGGDLVRAPLWVVSVTVLGDLGGRAPVRRGGARSGDVVAVIGDLGRSAAGYTLWDNGIDGYPELRDRHLAPQPPYGQGAVAAAAGATAMTDVSDGLLADLGHIATASGVGIDVLTDGVSGDRAAVAAAAAAVNTDPLQWVLGGGEDHALVATFSGAPPDGWRVVGRVIDGPARVLVDGTPWSGSAGWQSFG
ncbi:thiamine-monophosphate kinase [Mycolicibacterium wolinskyi]|uniref:Thiamine-monophosphate kinase n=1 Tax=Mycolicibacterium wolinskyi TaxID=59750 RepID=A0A132PGJ2_9MYCO|nr:thiamine-phosphate kinase [Mycolicibacterium wolinskyi]KWX21478.1 thiamine-monophosphate kinase [Mycolicibacterium wolinskyi]